MFLANKLKMIVHEIVSENQSALVSGRLITDNALIALEIFHSMKISLGEKRICCNGIRYE